VAPPDVGASGDHPPLGRRERNKAEKRRRIVAAGRFLFQTRGFDATTAAEIAARAGVGAGTFYLYASSKEDLLVAVFKEDVQQAWDDAFALVDPGRPLEQQLWSVFHHVTMFHERDPELARAFFKELLFVSPPIRETVAEFMRSVYERLEMLIVRSQEAGELDPLVPGPHLARSLFSLWYPVMQRRHAGVLTVEEALRRFEDALRLALWGLVGRGTARRPVP
jgi:AcrR family transcriptional regulator